MQTFLFQLEAANCIDLHKFQIVLSMLSLSFVKYCSSFVVVSVTPPCYSSIRAFLARFCNDSEAFFFVVFYICVSVSFYA